MSDRTSETNVTEKSVFFSGLDNPRGLKFGPDGFLYVAEGGRGGTEFSTTADDCQQVPPPVGPYTAGPGSARVSRISPDGSQRTSVVEGLPSSQSSARSGNLVSGVADIAFVGDTLYALISGAGCSHGLKGTTNGVSRIDKDGTTTQIADLSTFWQNHPIKNPDPNDPEPDGTAYSMIEVNGKLYVLDPHNAEIDEITTDGAFRRLIDISASQGHIVPTAMLFCDGVFYVGNLHHFPVHVGSTRIYQIGTDGTIRVMAPKLTAVTGLALDSRGALYALEMSTADNANPAPGTGRIVRVQPESKTIKVIVSGLTFPTAMTIGPDAMLYVSNYGFGFPPGKGQILRIPIPT